MVELGDKQEEYNCEFGRNAATVCDYVALVGERQTKSIYKGLVEAGFDESHIFVSPALGDALAKVGAIRTDKRRSSCSKTTFPTIINGGIPMKIKLAVMFGGRSVEHEISVISAIQAIHAVDKDKYDVIPIYITKNNEMYVGEHIGEIEAYKISMRLSRRARA